MPRTIPNASRRYFQARSVRLRQSGDPFCMFDLDHSNAQRVVDQLRAFAATSGRTALAIAMPLIVPGRLLTRGTFTETDPPAYEARAAARYVRGTTLRIYGGDSSCNIVANRTAANELASRIGDALRSADAVVTVLLHKGNGKRDQYVEVFADIELPRAVPSRAAGAGERDELGRLGAAGLQFAARNWPAEDFSDWEPHRE